jgi:hypothetical protein
MYKTDIVNLALNLLYIRSLSLRAIIFLRA